MRTRVTFSGSLVFCFLDRQLLLFEVSRKGEKLNKKCSNSKFPCQQQISLKRYISHNCVIKEIKTRLLVRKNNCSLTILILIRNIFCLSFIFFVFNHLFLRFERTKNIKKEETFHPSFYSSTLLVLHLFPSWLEIKQRIEKEKENERSFSFFLSLFFSLFFHSSIPSFLQIVIHSLNPCIFLSCSFCFSFFRFHFFFRFFYFISFPAFFPCILFSLLFSS